jgi:subtilisin family serine protease
MIKYAFYRFMILTSLTLAFAVLSQHAEAKIPTSSLFPSLSEKDEATVEKFLEYRNAKGRLFSSPVKSDPSNLWSQLDSLDDAIEGTSTAKAYANPKMPSSGKEIIVAVVDSGVDINHEDLKGKIWTNYAELNGIQGVDDDGNGYVDDVHGWNFLGNRDGTNVDATTLEVTREYARLKKKSQKKRLSETEQAYFIKVSAQFNEELKDAQDSLRYYQEMMSAINLLKKNGLQSETVEAVNQIQSNNREIEAAKQIALRIFGNPRIKNSEGLKAIIDDNTQKIQFCYNENFSSSQIVGDNPQNLDETGYGNNDVSGPDASHGTHVAGIIAANRDNNLGILGQADLVKIMSVRTVPNGDERDKDVANAIYYAVKNGAKIINMSFGKTFSPQKKAVDKAVLYAESKGVILVHASGNDGMSTEKGHNNFPLKKVRQNTPLEREVTNWIEVGASSKLKGPKMAAYFSNYGKSTVDVFAPGVSILSSIPGNGYAEFNGTSMATPQVAGVLALLMSRFPLYATSEIVEAVLENTTQYSDQLVNIPCKDIPCTGQISFSELSRTGGIVNTNKALEALLLK